MIQTGYILLTDISGYTMFLTRSELDHANDILQQLFNKQLVHIAAPLILSNLQGDAILAYLPDSADQQPQTVIETIERLYYDFRRLLELMKVNSSCTCNACVNMNTLDLKVFLHHGSFMIQEVGGKKELVGSDVILAHRMMKNSVKAKTGLNGYALITDAALQKLGGETMVNPLTPHEEEYEHIGTVKMHIYSLQAKWQAEREKERIVVPRERAMAYGTVEVPIPPEAAWNLLVDLSLMARWSGVNTIHRVDSGDDRIEEGAEMHCVHEEGSYDYLIVDWNPNEYYFTSRNYVMGMVFLDTFGLVRTQAGTELYYQWERPTEGENIDHMREIFEEMAPRVGQRFRELVQEQIAAGKIILNENPVEDKELVPPAPM
jgi:hypothetical protein